MLSALTPVELPKHEPKMAKTESSLVKKLPKKFVPKENEPKGASYKDKSPIFIKRDTLYSDLNRIEV